MCKGEYEFELVWTTDVVEFITSNDIENIKKGLERIELLDPSTISDAYLIMYSQVDKMLELNCSSLRTISCDSAMITDEMRDFMMMKWPHLKL